MWRLEPNKTDFANGDESDNNFITSQLVRKTKDFPILNKVSETWTLQLMMKLQKTMVEIYEEQCKNEENENFLENINQIFLSWVNAW